MSASYFWSFPASILGWVGICTPYRCLMMHVVWPSSLVMHDWFSDKLLFTPILKHRICVHGLGSVSYRKICFILQLIITNGMVLVHISQILDLTQNGRLWGHFVLCHIEYVCQLYLIISCINIRRGGCDLHLWSRMTDFLTNCCLRLYWSIGYVSMALAQ